MTSDDWKKAEDAGLVFLPMTGVNVNDEIEYCGELGYYWTSTNLDGEEGAREAYLIAMDYISVKTRTTSKLLNVRFDS